MCSREGLVKKPSAQQPNQKQRRSNNKKVKVGTPKNKSQLRDKKRLEALKLSFSLSLILARVPSGPFFYPALASAWFRPELSENIFADTRSSFFSRTSLPARERKEKKETRPDAGISFLEEVSELRLIESDASGSLAWNLDKIWMHRGTMKKEDGWRTRNSLTYERWDLGLNWNKIFRKFSSRHFIQGTASSRSRLGCDRLTEKKKLFLSTWEL